MMLSESPFPCEWWGAGLEDAGLVEPAACRVALFGDFLSESIHPIFLHSQQNVSTRKDCAMAKTRKTTEVVGKASKRPEHDDSEAVSSLLAASDHPMIPVVEAIRAAILGADPAITEGVKWNSASFYRCGWFATANLRPKGGLQVVLHHGAKTRADAALGEEIADESGLLKWLSADRAVIAIASLDEFEAKQPAFEAIIRQWSAYQSRLAEGTG